MDVSKYLNPPADACRNCDGCGKIANDDDQSPWWQRLPLPPGADLSVRIGLVRPEPYLVCKGTGKKP